MTKAQILNKLSGVLVYTSGEDNGDYKTAKANLMYTEKIVDEILDETGYYKDVMKKAQKELKK